MAREGRSYGRGIHLAREGRSYGRGIHLARKGSAYLVKACQVGLGGCAASRACRRACANLRICYSIRASVIGVSDGVSLRIVKSCQVGLGGRATETGITCTDDVPCGSDISYAGAAKTRQIISGGGSHVHAKAHIYWAGSSGSGGSPNARVSHGVLNVVVEVGVVKRRLVKGRP